MYVQLQPTVFQSKISKAVFYTYCQKSLVEATVTFVTLFKGRFFLKLQKLDIDCQDTCVKFLADISPPQTRKLRKLNHLCNTFQVLKFSQLPEKCMHT
jgi:hypothetical protein